MLSPSGSIFYQDSYSVIYRHNWFTLNDCQNVEYTTIIQDPKIPGSVGEILIDGNYIFKKGVITVEHKLIKQNGIPGYFSNLNNKFLFTTRDKSITFNPNQHLNRLVKVRNKFLEDGKDVFTDFNARIVAINSVNSATLDMPGFTGSAFIQLDDSYEIVAENFSQYIDFFQLNYPYADRPVDNFRYHLDSEYFDTNQNLVSDGSGWSDTDLNLTIWADVDAYGNTSAPTGSTPLVFMSVWGAE